MTSATTRKPTRWYAGDDGSDAREGRQLLIRPWPEVVTGERASQDAAGPRSDSGDSDGGQGDHSDDGMGGGGYDNDPVDVDGDPGGVADDDDDNNAHEQPAAAPLEMNASLAHLLQAIQAGNDLSNVSFAPFPSAVAAIAYLVAAGERAPVRAARSGQGRDSATLVRWF